MIAASAIEVFLSSLGSNKMFVGLTMILMNLGSRFIIGDLTKAQQSILASEFAKKIIVFCMFFVPTRDILISGMLTCFFFFIMNNILNENTRFSMLTPEGFKDDTSDSYYTSYSEAVEKRCKALAK